LGRFEMFQISDALAFLPYRMSKGFGKLGARDNPNRSQKLKKQ